MSLEQARHKDPTPGPAWEVFLAFLKLGLTSFGGPVAHVGYFRLELVETRKWVTDLQFGQLLAICQFLPGPASSQLGFSLGLIRAGWKGALAAFLAFTTPSAMLLVAFAAFLPSLDGPLGTAAIHGLKIVAFAVVAHGVLGMGRRLCSDARRASIAILAAAAVLAASSSLVQLLVVVGGAVAGIWLCRDAQPSEDQDLGLGYGPRVGWTCLILFAVLLVGLPLLAHHGPGELAVADAFYRAGAMVFGGGHVVLPLLEQSTVAPGWLTQDQFLAGYGAAQAIPGPMFSFAAYLGFVISTGAGGFSGAGIALLTIFLPGFLLVAGVLPLWRRIATGKLAARAIAGVGAAVVGLLAAALYDPIFVSAINSPIDAAIGLLGFLGLATRRTSAWVVVIGCVLASLAITLLP